MTKRILSVLLALVLVLGLSTVALAADTYTLTIADEAGREYTAYQIFTGNLGQVDGQTLLGDIQWGKDVTDKTGDAAATAKGLTNANIKDFASQMSSKVSGGTVATYSDGNYVFTLEPGYYLVAETTNLAAGQTASSFIVKVVDGAVTASPKRSGVPTPDKKIVGGTQDTATDAQVGDIVTFEVSAVVPTGYLNFKTYKLSFNDTMNNGLEFVEVKSVSPSTLAEADVKETSTTGFTYTWEDLTTNENLAGQTITIQYTAKVTDAALVQKENTFVLEYTNAPGSTANTTPKKVYVYTFNVEGLKVDGESKAALAGATFVLTNEDDKYYKLENGEVKWVASQDDATAYTSDANASTEELKFVGLDVGTYKLHEIATPAGYNSLTGPIEVTIGATYNSAGDVVTLTASTNASVNAEKDGIEATIENNKGTTLPSTGGIGTTLFYVIGGLLMAFAVVLLVAKKRTVNE